MKTVLKSILLAVLFCLNINLLFAQNSTQPSYSASEYMKVKPGMHAEYLKLEKAWKKIHEANIEAGKYDFWILQSVAYPDGEAQEYNYVTRIRFQDRKQLADYIENFNVPGNLSSILTPEEVALVNRTNEIRTRVKSEVWHTVEREIPENTADNKVVVVNFLDFASTYNPSELERVQREIWKPVEKVLHTEGRQNGWVLIKKDLPQGAAEPYAYATVDMFVSMEQYLSQGDDYMSYFKKAHPGKDVDKLLQETGNACTVYRQELRIILDWAELPAADNAKK